MAFSLKNLFQVFMVLMCLLVLLLLASGGCIKGQHGSSYGDIAVHATPNRRELKGMEKLKKKKKKMVMGVEWELRKAPSGPDPIHHNAAANPRNTAVTTSPPTHH